MVTMREERGHEVYLTHLWSLKLWRVEIYREDYYNKVAERLERLKEGLGVRNGEGIKIVDITHKIEKVYRHNLGFGRRN